MWPLALRVMARTVQEKRVIQEFVAHLGATELPGLEVDAWPDIPNSSSPDIDAIAGPFAIEHTSLDTVAYQRRDGAWFSRVVGSISASVGRRISFRLDIVFPYDGIAQGQDWDEISQALEKWIANVAPSLPEGRRTVGLPGVPFTFEAWKAVVGTPGVRFKRMSPPAGQLPAHLYEQVLRKTAKLKRYRAQGKRTILLLELYDIALMNVGRLVDQLRLAFPVGLPEDIEQLWYADTSVPDAPPDFHDLTDLFSLSTRRC